MRLVPPFSPWPVASSVCGALLLIPSSSFAQAVPPSLDSAADDVPSLTWNAPRRDSATPLASPDADPAARSNREQLPFAYATDPSLSRAGTWAFSYLVQGASGVDALRPLAANVSRQGLVEGMRVGWSAADWVAPFVMVQSHHPLGVGPGTRFAAIGGAKMSFLPSTNHAQIGVELAGLREFGGDYGGYVRVAASYELGRVLFVGNAHAEKIVAASRDSVDLLAIGGLSVAVIEPLRLGVEYIGQDLEDAFEDEEAEGGARHYAAPVASVVLKNGALWITGGPAFGLSSHTPAVMGRLQLLATF